MSGSAQLRYAVGVVGAIGVIGLLMPLLEEAPHVGRAIMSAGFIVAAWTLNTGSTVARVISAIIATLYTAILVGGGLFAVGDMPILGFVILALSAVTGTAAWFLIFSKALCEEVRIRHAAALEANRKKFAEAMVGYDGSDVAASTAESTKD